MRFVDFDAITPTIERNRRILGDYRPELGRVV